MERMEIRGCMKLGLGQALCFESLKYPLFIVDFADQKNDI